MERDFSVDQVPKSPGCVDIKQTLTAEEAEEKRRDTQRTPLCALCENLCVLCGKRWFTQSRDQLILGGQQC